MEAKLSNLFNVRPEEIDLEPVTFLALTDTPLLADGTTSVSVPEGVASYEYFEITAGATVSAGTATERVQAFAKRVDIAHILSAGVEIAFLGAYSNSGTSTDAAFIAVAFSIDGIVNTDATTIGFTSGASGEYSNPVILSVVGYKRRTSSTGLAEILSVLTQRNLAMNSWHDSQLVRNGHSFAGDWSALSVGDYGYEMCLKASSTHKGFVIEGGTYYPNDVHTVCSDGTVLGEFTTPSDGGNIYVAVPFANDKIDIYRGRVARKYTVPSVAELQDCNRFFENMQITVNGAFYGPNGDFRHNLFKFRSRKRNTSYSLSASPTSITGIFFGSAGSAVNYSVTIDMASTNVYLDGFRIASLGGYSTVYSTAGSSDVIYMASPNPVTITVNNEIALSEITDDSAHRIIVG